MFTKMTFNFNVQNKDSTLYDEIEDFINDVNKQMLKTAHSRKEYQKYIESFKVTEDGRLNIKFEMILSDEARGSDDYEKAENSIQNLIYETLLSLDTRIDSDSVPISEVSKFEAELSVRSNTEYILRMTSAMSW